MAFSDQAGWSTEILLRNEAATLDLAMSLRAGLSAGDVILLHGPIGAGKSVLARALIQALQADHGLVEDVPSPTFTLVQTYQAGDLEIWHSDLYRLSSVDEVFELGLPEAFETALCLVEWPDRLETETPASALHITLALTGDEGARRMTVSTHASKWDWLQEILARAAKIDHFLATAGWQAATRTPLASDASARRYQRLVQEKPQKTAVLMDAPPEKAGDIGPFLDIARWLRKNSLSAPEVIAQDRSSGVILLEDLGDALFARVCTASTAMELPLYKAAIDLLVEMARKSPPPDLPKYSAEIYTREALLMSDWYLRASTDAASKALKTDYTALIRAVCGAIKGDHRCVVLRDYHAENLLWLPKRTGVARVGLLDFQDALLGHPAYDLVSLLEDARRDTSARLQTEMIARYLAATGLDKAGFRQAYATLGAQRNLKIIGIFTRLYIRDGKVGYLDMIPRVWTHLQRDLKHPALAPLRSFVNQHFPAPTPKILARIRAAK